MSEKMTTSPEMKVIAHISTDFPRKFGIPRQSGLVPELTGVIRMEREYSDPDAFRGLSEYSHIWILWVFSEAIRSEWSPTVRPPRLGGNQRMGVFATRSPFRPNPIGLSVVRLDSVERTAAGVVLLHVSGIDLMDGTPILDIKPYLPHVDAIPSARGGFATAVEDYALKVDFPERLIAQIPPERRAGLIGALSGDPRPAYRSDDDRIYGMEYGDWEVKFRVSGSRLIVCELGDRPKSE